MRRILLLFTAMLTVLSAQAQIHQASSFGVKSDGVTLNTRSIQAAIDYISSHGGGVLELSVGRYLTGSIFLKDNVELTQELEDKVRDYFGISLNKDKKSDK